MSKPIAFERKIKVEISDADGRAIHRGSVLQHVEEKGVRGVVTRIATPDMTRAMICEMLGDVHIRLDRGYHRVTQKYKDYKHVPHDEQTYEERYLSWIYNKFYYDEDSRLSKDEQFAMSGITALLPTNAINWEGDYPSDFQDTLEYLMKHLMELKKKADKHDKTKN